MHLTLVIPELIWHEPGELDSRRQPTPALDRLLHWGRLVRGPRRPFEVVLADVLGDARTLTGAPVHLGEARANGEISPIACPSGHRLICADPIHLHFHQDRMLVADASLDPLTAGEAEALTDTLNRQFADTLRLIPATPTRWYALLDAAKADPLGPLPAPLSSVAGHQLPKDGFGRTPALRQLANALQMALHAHPITQARQDAGRRALNALWLWGDEIPVPVSPATQLAAPQNEPLSRGLASTLGHALMAVPEHAGTLLAGRPPTAVVFLDTLDAPGRYQDAAAYLSILTTLDRDWFAPVCAALTRGGLSGFRLVAPGAYGVLDWQIPPPTWWARRPWATPPQPLAERALALARNRST